MQTSNFSRAGKDKNAVAICRGIPPFYKGVRCISLAPSYELLRVIKAESNNSQSESDYRACVLAHLDPKQIYATLGPDAILLCWEGPNLRCHRRIVAEWLEQNLGIVIPEMGFERDQTPRFRDLPIAPSKPGRWAKKSHTQDHPGQQSF